MTIGSRLDRHRAEGYKACVGQFSFRWPPSFEKETVQWDEWSVPLLFSDERGDSGWWAIDSTPCGIATINLQVAVRFSRSVSVSYGVTGVAECDQVF